MHPLLRTLDLDPGAEPQSPIYALQPIRDAAAGSSRSLPVCVSLGLTPLLIYGLSHSLVSPATKEALQGALVRARSSVSIFLTDMPSQHPPVRALVGPEGPGGAGHREGTNSLDPRLAAHTALLSRPSEAIDPDSLSLSPRAEPVALSLNPALPPQVGGNGLARGGGRDAALGSGGLTRPPILVPVPDFKLVPIRQTTVSHQLLPGEAFSAREPLRVRILIGEDGVPTEAILVAGPEFLREKALRAAREWRFEPLGPHGLKAPQALVLLFYPNYLRGR
jgi:hypothetical protein